MEGTKSVNESELIKKLKEEYQNAYRKAYLTGESTPDLLSGVVNCVHAIFDEEKALFLLCDWREELEKG
jgi:hypothetical protein